MVIRLIHKAKNMKDITKCIPLCFKIYMNTLHKLFFQNLKTLNFNFSSKFLRIEYSTVVFPCRKEERKLKDHCRLLKQKD